MGICGIETECFSRKSNDVSTFKYPKNWQETEEFPPHLFQIWSLWNGLCSLCLHILVTLEPFSLKGALKNFFQPTKSSGARAPAEWGSSYCVLSEHFWSWYSIRFGGGKKNATVFLDDIAVASWGRVWIVFRINNYVNLRVLKAFTITKIAYHFPGVKT